MSQTLTHTFATRRDAELAVEASFRSMLSNDPISSSRLKVMPTPPVKRCRVQIARRGHRATARGPMLP